MLRIKLVKSLFGQIPRTRATVAALGLKKMHHTVEQEDTPVIRGMIHHVKHLLLVETVEGKAIKAPRKRAKAKTPEVAQAPAEAVAEVKPKARAPRTKKEKES
jgi:large subunit ribosomal protein L30